MDKITRCLWTGLGAQHMRGMFRSLQDAGRYLRPTIGANFTAGSVAGAVAAAATCPLDFAKTRCPIDVRNITKSLLPYPKLIP
ncbi:unnamed protein product [Brassica rapa subsp. narinosa]